MQKSKQPDTINVRHSDSYAILKEAITQTFGRKIITSRECHELVEDIGNKTSFIINFNTLRRFFGLINSAYPPSVTTTDILAKYCGFNSLHALVEAKTRADDEDEEYDRRLLEYIIKLFKEIQVLDTPDATFISFVALTIKYLDKHPEVANAFQKAIVKTKNGRVFYFEQFVNIDHLNSFYGDGLQLYLQEAKENEEKIFAHSLLCLKHWLTANDTLLGEHYSFIQQIKTPKKTPFVWGLYYTAQLLYADSIGNVPDTIFTEAFKHHLDLKHKPTALHESFEFIFCRALILTGHFEQAAYYSKYLLKKHPKESQLKDHDYFESTLLFSGMALSKTNDMMHAKHIFTQLKPRLFNFLTEKLDTILYLIFTCYVTGKENSKLLNQIKALIESNGFIRLKKISQF